MTLYIQHNHAHEKHERHEQMTPINIDPPLYGIFLSMKL